MSPRLLQIVVDPRQYCTAQTGGPDEIKVMLAP
jgi:hypothetical protein